MSYASRQGKHARISSRSPQALAICDRCGFQHNHVDLRWQHDYAGAGLINKRLLVCATCEDKPQHQLRTIVVPADPVPIRNPRVPNWDAMNNDYRITEGQTVVDPITGIKTRTGDTRVTNDGADRVTQQNGNDLYARKFVKRDQKTSSCLRASNTKQGEIK